MGLSCCGRTGASRLHGEGLWRRSGPATAGGGPCSLFRSTCSPASSAVAFVVLASSPRRPLAERVTKSIAMAGIAVASRKPTARQFARTRRVIARTGSRAPFLTKFREAMTPEIVEARTHAVNVEIGAAFAQRDRRGAEIKVEILRLERAAGNLVRFIGKGGRFETVMGQLREAEAALQGLRVELAEVERLPRELPPAVHRSWVMARLEHLEGLLRSDPVSARVEMAKHFGSDITISPLPSLAGEHRAEVRGAVNVNGLLVSQEAVRLQVVAAVGFEPATLLWDERQHVNVRCLAVPAGRALR